MTTKSTALMAPTAAVNPDDVPEASQPSPTLVVFARCTENDAPQDFDGGRVIFRALRAGIDPAILDASLVVSARTDAFLVQWPWKTRAAKQDRYYRITVEEVTAAALPPDPAEEEEIRELERRLAAKKEGARGAL